MVPESQQESHGSSSGHPSEVSITVDGKELKVQPGTYTVSDFKQLVGVESNRELDEIVRGEFKPLDDNAKITIEKHEKFVSHVRTGRSS